MCAFVWKGTGERKGEESEESEERGGKREREEEQTGGALEERGKRK